MIDRLDHLVLTVANLDATLAFYVDVLGMERRDFGEGKVALHFGAAKINLHPVDRIIEPRAARPAPGTADLCFIASAPLSEVIARLDEHQVPIEEGPVTRTGATGPLLSVYLRDPDENLIEISEPVDPQTLDRHTREQLAAE